MQTKETYGLVLYNRNYREDDKLVKLFTETDGKYMFFVRHASKSKLAAVLQPLTIAKFILKLNDELTVGLTIALGNELFTRFEQQNRLDQQ